MQKGEVIRAHSHYKWRAGERLGFRGLFLTTVPSMSLRNKKVFCRCLTKVMFRGKWENGIDKEMPSMKMVPWFWIKTNGWVSWKIFWEYLPSSIHFVINCFLGHLREILRDCLFINNYLHFRYLWSVPLEREYIIYLPSLVQDYYLPLFSQDQRIRSKKIKMATVAACFLSPNEYGPNNFCKAIDVLWRKFAEVFIWSLGFNFVTALSYFSMLINFRTYL